MDGFVVGDTFLYAASTLVPARRKAWPFRQEFQWKREIVSWVTGRVKCLVVQPLWLCILASRVLNRRLVVVSHSRRVLKRLLNAAFVLDRQRFVL
jgi:hypothetical protein